MSAPIELPTRSVLRWRMRRHGLSAEARFPDAVAALERLVFVRAPSGTTPYLSLWARVEGFDRAALDEAVFGQGRVLERRYIRGGGALTLPAFLPESLAHDKANTAGWLRDLERRFGVTETELRSIVTAVGSLIGDSRLTKRELKTFLRGWFGRPLSGKSSRYGLNHTLDAALELAIREGVLAQRRREETLCSAERVFYGLARSYPDLVGREPPIESLPLLCLRYHGIYGPASVRDLAWWLGRGLTETRAAVATLVDQGELIPVRCEDLGSELHCTPEAAAACAEEECEGSPMVALLPYKDIYLGYSSDVGPPVLSEAHRASVHSRRRKGLGRGSCLDAVIIDGRVAGGWRWRPKAGEVETCLEIGTDKSTRAALEQRCSELAKWLTEQLEGSHFHYAHRRFSWTAARFTDRR